MPNFMKFTGLASIFTIFSASLALADGSGSFAAPFKGFGASNSSLEAVTSVEAMMAGPVAVVAVEALDTDGARLIIQGRDRYFGEISVAQIMNAAPKGMWSNSSSTPEFVDIEDLTWEISELSSQDALAILNGRDRYLN